MPKHLVADRLLSRATFGARPGDREALETEGRRAWLERQLAGPASDTAEDKDTEIQRQLARFPHLDRSAREILAHTAASNEPMGMPGPMGRMSKEDRREIQQLGRRVGREVAGARVVRAVHGPGGLHEVMVDFWTNHFSVDSRKGMIGPVLPHYLNRAIVPHALGRFEELLQANAHSPAMLVYLDNWNSTAPAQDLGRQDRRLRRQLKRGPGGINENYARELMELHTLGVHGGYDQRDVVEVARVFTGWSLISRSNPAFQFHELLHSKGEKRVMGMRIREAGEDEGRRVLRALARHPSTARHLSTKIVQRFVADSPPPALVDRATARYLESNGSIRDVLRLVLLSPEFASEENRKLKTPLRLLASALRATGGMTDGGPGVLRVLERMGEIPFGARSPAGYPETSREWTDPGSLLERMNLAFALAQRRIPGTRLGPKPPTPSVRGFDRRREAQAMAIASRSFQWA